MKRITIISFVLLSAILLLSSIKIKHSQATIAVADLSVAKVDSPDPVNTGSTLTYTITVTNNGPDTASNASWSDSLPAGTTFVAPFSAPGGWSCTTPAAGNPGTINCSNPSFAVGSAVFTLNVSIAPTVPADSIISNTATVTSSTSDSNSNNNSGTATTTVLSPANVTGDKSVSGGTSPGSTASYLIVLKNSSSSDQQDNPGAEFTDVLPADLTLVSASASAGIATANTGTNTVTWNGVVPAGGDSVTISIDATIKSGTEGHTIANQGTINYDADGNGTNESSNSTNSVSFVVGPNPPSADLALSKSSPSQAHSDTDLTFTITVTNLGPDAATNASFTDSLPGGLTFVSFNQTSGPVWDCGSPGSTTTCSIASLAANSTSIFSFTGHIPNGSSATYTNETTVNSYTDSSHT